MDPKADDLLAGITRTERFLAARRRSTVGWWRSFWIEATRKTERNLTARLREPDALDRLVEKGWLPSQAAALIHVARTVTGEPGELLRSLVVAASIGRFIAPPYDDLAPAPEPTGWTRHGHAIEGVPQVGSPPFRARCGGPVVCVACALDASRARKQ